MFKFLPDDGAEHARFGNSVSISGGIAIVGAFQDGDLCPPDDPFCEESGSAYLFNTATGQQIAKLTADDGEQGDQFGISVAISGTTAIVGARDDGSAYLFDISDPANPVQITKLLPNDGASGDFFGNSVAISGDTVIVGSPRHDDNGSNSGAAYLFDVSVPASPIQIAKLLANDGAASDQFGTAVSISGAAAIIGAIADNDNGNGSGSAYLFDTTTGLQIAKLLPYDGAANDQFGTAVAISGSYAIAGSIRHDDNGSESGSAYLFDISNPSNPFQISKLLPSDGSAGDQFGHSVAINGNTAVIGAFLDNDNGPSSGSAYVFKGTDDPGVPNDSIILISEVVDGTLPGGLPKWVELTNCGNTILDMSQFSFGNMNNGASTLLDGAAIQLTGSLAAGSSYVFAYAADSDTTFEDTYGFAPDQFSGDEDINGDDVLILFRGQATGDGSNATIVDIYGVIGVDGTDEPWEYIDSYSYRLPEQSATDTFDEAQWFIAGPNALETGDDAEELILLQTLTFPGVHDCLSNCPWDLDKSGSVGTSDLLALFAQWGTPGTADFDGSGAVGTADLLILFANWGPCP